MEVKEEYIKKYWRSIVLDQLDDKYVSEGFNVFRDKKFNGVTPDLFLEKDGDKKIIVLSCSKFDNNDFLELHRYAKSHNISFEYIPSNYSSLKKTVEIEGIEMILCNYIKNNTPDSISELGHNHSIEDIIDLNINELYIDTERIVFKGTCLCETIISLDGDSDTEYSYYFPCKINIHLSINEEILILGDSEIEADVSSFYE